MKIVIDIPEEEYRCVQITGHIGNTTQVSNAIFDGTPLPKGCGDLIDANYLKDVILLYNFHGNNKNIVPYSDKRGYRLRQREVDEAIINAPVIIKADKAESEE